MATLIPVTIFAYWVSTQIADGVMSGITSLHESYLSLEKSMTTTSSRKEAVELEKQAYKDKVVHIREKYQL